MLHKSLAEHEREVARAYAEELEEQLADVWDMAQAVEQVHRKYGSHIDGLSLEEWAGVLDEWIDAAERTIRDQWRVARGLPT